MRLVGFRGAALGLSLVIAQALAVPPALAADAFTAEQRQAIEAIVRDYLIKNPDVMLEVLEAAMPIVFEKKELRIGSGGAGASRGGDGQTIAWHMRTNSPWLLNAVPSRTSLAPEGLGGGAPGAAGKFLINGKPVVEARKMLLQPADQVVLETPGGGGYGAPR